MEMKEQCTTLEQSKKLLELGFIEDTASMRWNESTLSTTYAKKPSGDLSCIPGWTISDMMSLIKSCKIFRNYDIDDFEKVAIENIETFKYFNKRDNLKDNLFDCLVWLKENKYL